MNSKEESWKKYVSSINGKTPIKKIWKRFRKVSGTNTYSPRHVLIVDGKPIHDTKEICNQIGLTLSKTSSDQFYNQEFRRYNDKKEKQDYI